jgi:hypothetical protein
MCGGVFCKILFILRPHHLIRDRGSKTYNVAVQNLAFGYKSDNPSCMYYDIARYEVQHYVTADKSCWDFEIKFSI